MTTRRTRRKSPFAPIDDAIEAIRDGEMIIVVDDEDRENEGDLTIAAREGHARGDQLHGHARPRADLPADDRERLDELEISADGREEHRAVRDRVLRLDRSEGRDQHRHLGGRSRGDDPGGDRSARRGRRIWRGPATCSRCARATAACWCAPGRPKRRSISRGSPGSYPAGVICEIMNDDGTMARVPELTKFAKRHKLLMITIADLIQYRMRTEALVQRVAAAALPTEHGEFRVIALREPASTARRTSRWSRATSATARTCWCACTRSA